MNAMFSLADARKLPLLIGLVVLALGLGLVSTATEDLGFLVLAAGAGVAVLAVIVGVWSIQGLATALIMGGAFTVSFIALRAGAEISLADLLLGAALAPVLILAIRNRTDPSAGPAVMRWHLPVLGLTSLVVVGGLAGTFTAGDQALSLSELGRFAASSMVVIVLFWLWAPPRRTLERLCWVLVLGASVNALLGLVMPKLGGRAMGLSTHPNHLALACALAFGVALGLLVSSPGAYRRLVLTGCLAILGVGVITSGSRAGLVGVVVTVAVFLVLTKQWKLVGLGAVLVGLVAGAIYFNLFAIGELNAVNRMRGDRSSFESDRERMEAAEQTIDIIRLNPVTGSGFESAKAAHSIYLQLWASAGLLGLAFALGLAVLTLRILLEAKRRHDHLAMGVAAAYAGYLVLGAVSNILWDRYVWVHLAVLVTLVATESAAVNKRPPPAPPAPRNLARTANSPIDA